MRKEYVDRWNAPLVNPGITFGEYEEQKERQLELFEVEFNKFWSEHPYLSWNTAKKAFALRKRKVA